MMHRDVKPANVFLDKDGNYKVRRFLTPIYLPCTEVMNVAGGLRFGAILFKFNDYYVYRGNSVLHGS